MENDSSERGVDRKERLEILELYRESGLSKVDFAKEYGLTYKSFCNWSRLMEKEEISDEGAPTLLEVDTTFQEVSVFISDNKWLKKIKLNCHASYLLAYYKRC